MSSRGVFRPTICYSRLQRCLANCKRRGLNDCVIPDWPARGR